MKFELEFLDEANKDYKKLDGSQRIIVNKALSRILTNPYSTYEGGYGKPLANKSNSKLAGFLKVKLKSSGIRIVYKLKKVDDKILIIVIGARADSAVYIEASSRIEKYDL